jgi:hypothetical protein
MKKFLLMAAVVIATLATSCTKDEAPMEPNQKPAEQKSEITFNVSTLEYFTRAYGSGEQATNLHWAVYDHNTKDLLFHSETPTIMNGLTAKVSIHFVNNLSYDVLFWAESADAPYDVDWEHATFAYDTNASLKSNQESYDAFFCYQQIGLVTGPISHDVTLKRPFAQVNIATADYATAGITIEQTKVMVENVYASFNLRENSVTGTPQNITFDYSAMPNEKLTVNSAQYDLLAINYLLVPAEQSLINIAFEYNDSNANNRTITYQNIPVQQNYKTNIVGNLLGGNSSASSKAILTLQ